MEPNNFLNRMKLNLDLVNRNSYKATSSKLALIHPLMKYPLQTLNSQIENNNINNLGFFIPINNYNTKNIKYTVNEHNIIIDSADRDISVYKNPLKFTVKLNPLSSDNKPYIPTSTIKNLKYLQVVNVMLPLHYQIHRKQINNDNILIDFIETHIVNWNNNFEIDYNNKKIQICNIDFKNNDEWEINYTIDEKKIPLYCIIKYNNQYITYEYNYIERLLQNKKNIFLCIEEYNNKNVLSTDSNNKFIAPLHPKKIRNNFILYNIKNRILFKNSNLSQLTSLNITLKDHNGETLQIPFLDLNITYLHKLCNCSNKLNYSCSCYYLRHPLNPLWQMHLIIKVGNYDLIL